jgi:hypothetical protein
VHLIRSGGLRPEAAVVIGVRARVARLLDLRDPVIRQQLGILGQAEITGPWKNVLNAPTQVLGDAVFNDSQFEGMLYPSAQNPGHDCLILFRLRLLPGSRVDFFDIRTKLVARLP